MKKNVTRKDTSRKQMHVHVKLPLFCKFLNLKTKPQKVLQWYECSSCVSSFLLYVQWWALFILSINEIPSCTIFHPFQYNLCHGEFFLTLSACTVCRYSTVGATAVLNFIKVFYSMPSSTRCRTIVIFLCKFHGTLTTFSYSFLAINPAHVSMHSTVSVSHKVSLYHCSAVC